ncbi:MAG TPA: HPF/RaiA family ribosome-associated protein [Thermoanaerobaculia bacterium]|nr:HPF/RaiA family ribosome-associated protein [Thermoanaerobaculia bacterium]
MSFPLHTQFLEMSPPEALEERIHHRFSTLERFSKRIQRCRVWVEKSAGHHRRTPLYEVQVRLTMPGDEIVVADQPGEDDLYMAIRNAFDATRRKLQDYGRVHGAQVLAHPRRHGRIAGARPRAA